MLCGRYQALACAACFADEWQVGSPLLIIVPKSLRRQWAEELERFFPQLGIGEIHCLRSTVGGNEGLPTARVVITSFRLLSMMGVGFWQRDWAMVVIDESSKMRTARKFGATSKETEACAASVRRAKRALLLSGTPLESRPYELWHQLDALTRPHFEAEAASAGKKERVTGALGSFTEFVRAYNPLVEEDQGGGGWQRPLWQRQRQEPLPKRLIELNVLLRAVCMVRRVKADVLSELPPKYRKVVELLDEEEEDTALEDLATDVVTDAAAGGAETAPESMGAAEEGVTEGGVSEYRRCGEKKVGRKDFREMLSRIASGVAVAKGGLIVFAHHRAVMDELFALLGRVGAMGADGSTFKVARIDGATPAEDRATACADFQSPHSDVRVVLISMTAGGMGVNLQAATTIVFAELPTSSTLLQQSESRAHRQGLHHPVLVYLVVAQAEKAERRLWLNLQRSGVRVGRILDGAAAEAALAVDGIAQPTTVAPSSFSAAVSAADSGKEREEGEHLLPPPSPRPQKPVSRWGRQRQRSMDKREKDQDKARKQISAVQPSATGTEVLADEEGGDVARKERDEPGQDKVDDECLLSRSRACPDVWFLVSQHTGLVHLCHSDGRRWLLDSGDAVSFRWEAICYDDDANGAGCVVEGGDNVADGWCGPAWLQAGSGLRARIEETAAEWRALGPRQQGRLVGRPVAPPLSSCVELAEPAAKLTGSTNRVRERAEMLTANAPDGATLTYLLMLTGMGGRDTWPQYVHDTTGVGYCSWVDCRVAYDRPGLLQQGLVSAVGNRQFFCSDACRQRYTLRSDGGALRRVAYEQDQGVCQKCGLDADKTVNEIRHVDPPERRAYLLAHGFTPQVGFTKQRLEKLSAQTDWRTGVGCNLWEADHRLRVADGGGECDGANIDTLCLPVRDRRYFSCVARVSITPPLATNSVHFGIACVTVPWEEVSSRE